MKTVFVILLGYLLGSLSPSALIGKIKKVDMKKEGTKNLGASNTMLIFGKAYGAFVMLFDIAKSYFAVKAAQIIFPTISFAGILAGGASVVGHIYPFYLKFKGGKGLASYGGMILALDGALFMMLLSISLVLMFVVNYGFAMPISAGILFPFLYAQNNTDAAAILIAFAVSVLVIFKHLPNIKRARQGNDVKIREFIKLK